jgi:hypothetical protein
VHITTHEYVRLNTFTYITLVVLTSGKAVSANAALGSQLSALNWIVAHSQGSGRVHMYLENQALGSTQGTDSAHLQAVSEKAKML